MTSVPSATIAVSPIDKRNVLLGIVGDFVSRRTRVADSTRLYHDLFISGDDAAELLERVHKEFGTTFDGFSFDRYFPDEEGALSYFWLAKLFRFKGKRWRDFTFGHLLSVVENGRWFQPDGELR